MLDIKIIRNNPDLVKDNITKRNLSLNLDDFLKIDAEKLELIVKVDELRAIKNKVSKEIPTLSNEERPAKISEMKKL
jgi:seryl-tRNA synthetase